MYDFEAYNKELDKVAYFCGYSWEHVKRKNPNFDFTGWVVIRSEYID